MDEYSSDSEQTDMLLNSSSKKLFHRVFLPNIGVKILFLTLHSTPTETDFKASKWSTYFIIKLASVAKLDPAISRFLPTSEQLILQQAKFIAAFGNEQFNDLEKAISLRLITYPDRELPQRGKVNIGFICRISSVTKQVSEQTLTTFAESFIRLLPGTEKQVYQFSVVSSETEFTEYFDPFPVADIAEICRREQLVDIRQDNAVYVLHPFKQVNNFVQLLWNLLKARDRSLVDISLSPTKLLPWERAEVESIITTCETLSTETEMLSSQGDGELRGVTRYSASSYANDIRYTYRNLLHQLEAQAFLSKIHIASPQSLNTGLVESLGIELSGLPFHESGKNSVGFGGHIVFYPTDATEFKLAVDNLCRLEFAKWDYSIAPKDLERLRHVYGIGEANCFFRLPIPNEEGLPGVELQQVKYAPLPSTIPTEGVIIGESVYEAISGTPPVRIKDEDRRRHMYVVGKTGTGKSTLLMQMAVSDIEHGKGVCVIDPHGELVEDILTRIPAERAEDVVIFDPADTERPVGFNMLETYSEQETHLVVNEFIGLLRKLYDPLNQGIVGPRFEHGVRNSMLTVMAEPPENPKNTLIEVVRVITNDKFRQEKMANVTDPLVRSYWLDQIAKTSDFHKSEVLDYIVSKFGRFVTNRLVRNIIGQSQSALNFRQIMDEQKILLVNLSKGKIGPENSVFLGSLILPKLLISALGRIELPAEQRHDFYLYVDEFQNFASETFSTMLSEARKYGLCLTLANQYLSQLPHYVRDAVFGNVGTIIAFRMGTQDTSSIAHEFYPVFSGDDLTNLPKYTTCVNLLVDGVSARPFSMRTLYTKTEVDKQNAQLIRKLSRLRYGRDARVVEEEIVNRMGQTSMPSSKVIPW